MGDEREVDRQIAVARSCLSTAAEFDGMRRFTALMNVSAAVSSALYLAGAAELQAEVANRIERAA